MQKKKEVDSRSEGDGGKEESSEGVERPKQNMKCMGERDRVRSELTNRGGGGGRERIMETRRTISLTKETQL